MKKIFLLLTCVYGLASCQHISITDGDVAEVRQSKDVKFVVAGIAEEYSTRATIQSVGMTDLWIYEGSNLLKHQVSTDGDFGLPTVSLTYGTHDLTFVASSADGQAFSTSWTCTKVKDTFAKCMNVSVSGSSSASRQVQLARRNSKIAFTVQDAVPAEVKTMHITAGNHLGLDASLGGVSAGVYEVYADISSKVGMTGFAPMVTVLTANATDEEDVAVMIEFLGADGTVLYHYERTVKVKANRCTNLTGKYFQGDPNMVSINEEWDAPLDIDL